MNRKLQLIVAVVVFALVMLACGTSTDVKVNTPAVSDGSQSETKAPQPTSAPEVGTARSNPAPVGSEVVADDMAFVILNVIRPADDLVRAGNEFNTTPDPNQEYIFVEVQVTCKKASSDEKCSFSPAISSKLLGSKGVEYDPDIFIAGVSTILESTDFYSGVVVSGHIPFIISKDDSDLLFIYDPFLGDRFYLSLPQ